ncbi:MAG: hypothetical protein EHM45_18190 [Desulfobacteraceae bacterium]|nr:MAG: hypothetical protein EHM45_18190 [Desulfobacteraceae bacterium]
MRVTVNIPDHIFEEAKKYAKEHAQSMSAITAEAVQKYMASCKKAEAGKELLEMAGKIKIADHVYEELERLRNEDRY